MDRSWLVLHTSHQLKLIPQPTVQNELGTAIRLQFSRESNEGATQMSRGVIAALVSVGSLCGVWGDALLWRLTLVNARLQQRFQ